MESGNDLIFKNALAQFADSKCEILDASLNLLKQIVGADKYTLGSQKPRSVKDLCQRRNVTYQQILNEVVDNIKSTYYVARLDDRAFSRHTDSVELESALEEASEEKYKGILIFAIDVVENTKLNRTLAAELTRVFNKLSNNPVILFIRQGASLSISTCERKAKKRDVGEKMGKVNLLQNINCAKPATGHLRILENLQINSKIRTFDALYEHWFEVFNTKTLTDKFYKELYSWYMWVVNDPNTHFPENAHLPEHENEKKNVKIIRLITRLLFVWFLKAKKVKEKAQPEMGLVPEKLFEIDELKAILNDFDPNSATDGEYYNAILQNLFFATLNDEVNSRRFVDTSNAYRSKKGYTVKNLYRDNKDKSGSWFKISHDEVLDLFKTVPFLNCGLFECLDKYKRTDINYDVDRIFDGFSTKSGDKFRACLPNRLFFADELPEITIQVTEKGKKVPLKIKSKGLINLLNEYVFTVEENTPLDQQVSLDPELLGKVFENLLAAYNPETEESARKSSGSYYTPREIVEYMVNESLIQYLKTNLNADEATEAELRNLVSPSNPDFKLSPNQQDVILEALYHCRILDPACGSGAFPMGMLQQMVHIISRLDDKNEKWQKLITKKATEETAKAYENKELNDEERKKIIADIESSFTNSKNNPDYTRKLYLIQNCIFGVDIQPIAMMISKLRFFISLICEQDENAINFDDVKQNFGIHTLPNLETKFVAANSLLTPDVKKYTGNWTNDEHLDQLKNELMELRYRHVTARSMKDKMEIRTLDDEKRQEINDYILSTQAHADPVKIAMFEDQIAHLMLERRLYEGENIVEEYVDVQGDFFADTEPKLVRKDANRAKRNEIDRQIRVCQAQIDHEKAKENITGFAAAVKQLTEWNPYDQVKSSPFFDPDWMFGVSDGFDIVMGNPPYVQIKKLKEKEQYSREGFHTFDSTGDIYCLFYELGVNLLKRNGNLIFITSNKWLKSNYGEKNRAFIYEKAYPKILIDLGPGIFKSAAVDTNVMLSIKSNKNKTSRVAVLKDSISNLSFSDLSLPKHDIWNIQSADFQSIKIKLDAINTYLSDFNVELNYGILTGANPTFILSKEKAIELIALDKNNRDIIKPLLCGQDLERYSAQFHDNYLLCTHNGVKSKGILPVNVEDDYPTLLSYFESFGKKFKQRGEQGDRFYNLRNCTYIMEYLKPKILYADIVQDLGKFYYDENGYYTNDTAFMICGDNLKFLLGVLNSKGFSFFYKNFYCGGTLGKKGLRYKRDFLMKVPIPDIQKTRKPIIELVDKILKDKKNNSMADTTVLEQKIDVMVYLLYGLTWNEVQIIENYFEQIKKDNESENKKKKGEKISSNLIPKLNIDEEAYKHWLEQYVKNKTFPNDEELVV